MNTLAEQIAQRNNRALLEEIMKHTDGYSSLGGKSYYKWGCKPQSRVDMKRHEAKATSDAEERRVWWQSLTEEEREAYVTEKNAQARIKEGVFTFINSTSIANYPDLNKQRGSKKHRR